MSYLKVSTLLLLSLLLYSCDGDSDLPDCIQTITESNPQIQIQTQVVDGSTRYWLNTGANESDGDEYIVSSSCDTLCYYGGWVDPDCTDDYPRDAWTLVWP